MAHRRSPGRKEDRMKTIRRRDFLKISAAGGAVCAVGPGFFSNALRSTGQEPAKIISNKYGRLGTLAVGSPADVTIFDPDMAWVVDTKAFASKGKNTPLAGSVLKGKIIATISQGSLVYKDNSVKVEVK